MHEQHIRVVISLDVEEEGLFRGSYSCRDLSIENLSRLQLLQPLIRRGVRPTLFCAYSALASDCGRRNLEKLLPDVEIGAHLHHWNTPPLDKKTLTIMKTVAASDLTTDLFAAKLQNVLICAKAFSGVAPASFRMGRWDMHPRFFPVLAANGIRVDASIRPLHNLAPKGPNHFAAPTDPYIIETGHGSILEVPLTVTPLLRSLARLPEPFNRSLRHWGALALLPVEHPLWLMRLTTILHLVRGGSVISLTWHSSEMFPGGNPSIPSEQSVNAFLAKIHAYLDWLESRYNVEYVNMNAMPASKANSINQALEAPRNG